jgi:hypothetical protein
MAPPFVPVLTSCSLKPPGSKQHGAINQDMFEALPSVKLTVYELENHHFSLVNQLFLWPFSIAMFNYYRLLFNIRYHFPHDCSWSTACPPLKWSSKSSMHRCLFHSVHQILYILSTLLLYIFVISRTMWWELNRACPGARNDSGLRGRCETKWSTRSCSYVCVDPVEILKLRAARGSSTESCSGSAGHMDKL